jgi:signal transduction histidine kinase
VAQLGAEVAHSRPRRQLSLRWRLTLSYLSVTGLIMLVASVLFYLSLAAQLQQFSDQALRDAAGLAASQLGGDEPGAAAETVHLQLSPDITLAVYDPAGRQTDRLGSARVNGPLQAGFLSAGAYRVYSLRLVGGEWVQAIRSQAELLQALATTRRSMLLGFPLLLLAGLLSGYWLSDRALRPVDAVSRLAAQVARSGEPQARVPQAPGDDEMARLTGTVNAMLDRLEQTIERERTFALAAAHELRTPLALLRGQASLTLQRPRSVSEYQEDTGRVLSAAEEMQGVVERLLALAQVGQPTPRRVVELAQLAAEVVERLEPVAQVRGTRLHLITVPVRTLGDAHHLRLVLLNLVENALKYGRPGGHVWIRVGPGAEGVLVSVTDDGPGIPESEIQRLRQPFQRGLGQQNIPGSGLGLALVSSVVAQHGSTLHFTRAPEGGLRVTVTLPAAP